VGGGRDQGARLEQVRLQRLVAPVQDRIEAQIAQAEQLAAAIDGHPDPDSLGAALARA
jgi:hypothetical protein